MHRLASFKWFGMLKVLLDFNFLNLLYNTQKEESDRQKLFVENSNKMFFSKRYKIMNPYNANVPI